MIHFVDFYKSQPFQNTDQESEPGIGDWILELPPIDFPLNDDG